MAQFAAVAMWLEALRRCALRDFAPGAVIGGAVGEKTGR